jgi:copper resistance protein C
LPLQAKTTTMAPGQQTRGRFLLLTVLTSCLAASPAVAHAVLLESSPAPKSSVTGPDVPLRLRFNVRIDVARSRLTLILPDGSSQALEVEKPGSPDLISSQAKGLRPGAYVLRWQVLASDGHITRGEIPFTVAAS